MRTARKRTPGMDTEGMHAQIDALAAGKGDLRSSDGEIVEVAIAALDAGIIRTAQPRDDGTWQTNQWVKRAILLYFKRRDVGWIGDRARDAIVCYDKLPLKRNFEEIGVRCVPPAVARFGSFLGRGVILMPSFVNIGAYVDEGTMIDTWATVGSCAQIGRNVHLSGGVGIGGVLEPPQASPVIVEDGAFVGSRCIVVEGVHVGEGAVLGAGVVLTASTPVVDVRNAEPVTSRGRIPARAVVIPGTMPKRFAAGEYQVPCALIIGTRDASTDLKTSLNAALRDYEVAA
ncbi:MAG: 2,3,4,5-tetrahydropyridine-2,6-dicarboxylate N-succinyltransferase [Candidatus Eremiobacteraeota bacterium]|nr:2,3,4,5-tetrahydropyridine-2,6-dicarboxylate N-succinyltransferase [Candidatus Eremiobacteraeota bacterium]